MSRLWIEDDGAERLLDSAGEPLSFGGTEDDLVPGSNGTSTVGYFGWSEGELFVQPADGATTLSCNGIQLSASRWLRHGDVLAFGRVRVAVGLNGDEPRLMIERRAAPEEPVASPAASTGVAAARADFEGVAPILIRPAEFVPSPMLEARRRRPLRFASFGWLVGAFLLLGSALWLWSTKSVRLIVEPTPDRVSVSGGFAALHRGERYLLRPGAYELTAEKEGYRALTAPFEVGDTSGETVTFELEPLPGRLQVVVRPQTAVAEVSVDGQSLGPPSALELAPLERLPGEYSVEVRAAGYLDFVGSVTVGEAGSLAIFEAELVANSAPVSFRSSPSGARIDLDGAAIGTTPLTAELGAGSRQVTALLSGYKPQRLEIEIAAGQPLTVPEIRLTPADGNLVVQSEPEGATVTIDGIFRGRTPLDLELAPDREVEVAFSKSGFETARRSVDIAAGESALVSIDLEPVYGELEMMARPSTAELWVDGEPKGSANQTIRLTAVEHQVEVRAEGFEPFRQTVTPVPDLRQSLSVELKTAAEIRAAATPEVVTTAAGQSLRLLSGGTFRLGASRREPGRRANEGFREVELVRPFYLGTREVTNAEFRKFRTKHLSGKLGSIVLETDHHPVVQVSWEDAARYCNWLSDKDSLPHAYVLADGRLVLAQPATTGYRLPSEAEWARAARYSDGKKALKYPWGDTLPLPAGVGNYGDRSAATVLGGSLADYHDGFAGTSPPQEFPPNALGLYGLGDNVSEWMNDLYTVYSGGSTPLRDPVGPTSGASHVIRGASWMHTVATRLRLSYRDSGDLPRPDVGFRLARYAE